MRVMKALEHFELCFAWCQNQVLFVETGHAIEELSIVYRTIKFCEIGLN